jgi:hypothetical protein
VRGFVREKYVSRGIHPNSSNHLKNCAWLVCLVVVVRRGLSAPSFSVDNFSFNTKRTFLFISLNLLLGFMFHRVFAGHKILNVVRQNAFKKHIKGEEETC